MGGWSGGGEVTERSCKWPTSVAERSRGHSIVMQRAG